MYSQKFRILITGILLFLFHLTPAGAVTLTVGTESGRFEETLTIPITVDNPEGVAGAAFTIVYDSALTVTVSSDFFDTFYSQFNPLPTTGAPNPDGGEYGSSVFPVLDDQGAATGDVINIPAVVDSNNYYQPLIANSAATGLTVSAARCVPGPASGPAVLFSLEVQLNAGEPLGAYPIAIIPTVLNNTNAGYAPEGEGIDLLIGSDPSQSVDSSFTVLLDDVGYGDYVTNGQAEFTVPVDSDSDGLHDNIENAGCTDPNDADTDDDGIPDGEEDANQNGTLDSGETNPCEVDTDGDGIQDGTELGYAFGHLDTDVGIFQPDLDKATTTNPLDADSDNDGLHDGQEDLNRNGRVDAGETDPSVKDANTNTKKPIPWIYLLLLND